MESRDALLLFEVPLPFPLLLLLLSAMKHIPHQGDQSC